MSAPDLERLQAIKTLPSLLAYLRDELDWPIDADEIEDVFFEYDPEELGLAPDQAAGIKEIKQLRPMDAKQPWGIFWVNFEKKRLPVVMLRRILGHLVIKKRASANKAAQRAWHASDLLFVSAYGEDHDRAITFAHFAQDAENAGDLPVLKVLGWDGGDTVLHLADAHRALTERLRWPANPENLAAWRDQWAAVFILRHREVISTTTELVEELANLATSIRKRADAILSRESDGGPMRRLYGAFRTALIHDLSEDDFADVIAQTISYGLLAARFSSKGGISIKSLVDMIPPTNPFLRELLAELLAVAGRKKGAFDFDELGIQDVVDLLNQANAEAVKSDFGNRTRNEDPVIHFYEHFLHAYDRQKKVQRGAFYTPTPVVSYIVRSVHELLQTEFGLEDGLADTTTWGEMVKRSKDVKIPDAAKPGDPFVLILDPATGTATFLVEVIEVIFMHLKKKWTDLGKKPAEISRLWNEYVPKNLLPRLYGYELMMAPYTIAHMKLALKLQEINARLGQPDFQFMYTDRAHIYLTNSLEPAGDEKQGVLEGIFSALAHEAAAVNRVKKGKRFTLVIGNPPYAGISSNRGEWISALIDDYRLVDGEPLEEKKIWVKNDYVKFLRLSQLIVDTTALGIIGMITDHSYLDSPTFRGLRNNLLRRFEHIQILNLHGNSKRRETGPDGIKDENVFDITQGVAIGIFAKGKQTKPRTIYADLWGERVRKHEQLLHTSSVGLRYSAISPQSPFYLYTPNDTATSDEYSAGWLITDIFPVGSNGVQTSRDSLVIAGARDELIKRFEWIRDTSVESSQILRTYGVEDKSFWRIDDARRALRGDKDWKRRVTGYAYRPLDNCSLYASPDFVHRLRREVMQHMARPNLALCVGRAGLVVEGGWNLVFAVKAICDHNLFYRGSSLNCPLYRYHESDELWAGGGAAREARSPNMAAPFSVELSRVLALKHDDGRNLPSGVSPEDIFHYAYAVFHSPTYRTRYAEFLKIDFPRLPLTSSLDLFRTLAKLGGELVALHLMESPKLDKHITKWIGGKSPEVEKVTYCDETVWTDKAQSEGFRGVPEPVWNFHIGGYQVCEKWLKDRKGRTLSADDITHYHRIVVVLCETIRLMAEIDEVIEKHGGWPKAFQVAPA